MELRTVEMELRDKIMHKRDDGTIIENISVSKIVFCHSSSRSW